MACDGAVVALVHGGEDVVVFPGDVVDLLDLGGGEVGQAEAAEHALFVHFVDAREGFGERDAGVGRVQVEHVELRDGDSGQTVLGVFDHAIFGHGAGTEAADEFGVDGEAGALLEGADGDFGALVQTGRVEGCYAFGEEEVEDFGADFRRVEIGAVGQAGAAHDEFDHCGGGMFLDCTFCEAGG